MKSLSFVEAKLDKHNKLNEVLLPLTQMFRCNLHDFIVVVAFPVFSETNHVNLKTLSLFMMRPRLHSLFRSDSHISSNRNCKIFLNQNMLFSSDEYKLAAIENVMLFCFIILTKICMLGHLQ